MSSIRIAVAAAAIAASVVGGFTAGSFAATHLVPVPHSAIVQRYSTPGGYKLVPVHIQTFITVP